jgi:hypothetical protein
MTGRPIWQLPAAETRDESRGSHRSAAHVHARCPGKHPAMTGRQTSEEDKTTCDAERDIRTLAEQHGFTEPESVSMLILRLIANGTLGTMEASRRYQNYLDQTTG